MLKKKILGAKVLDTNGYVLATRLVTPVKQSGKYQLVDILNADAVDQNDLVDSDTTTVERVDGKSKTNVNVMSDDDVLNLIDKIQ